MYIPKGATPIEDDEYIPKGATPIGDEASTSQNNESLGTKALNFINQAGGTVGRAIGYGAADLMDVPVIAANYANQKVAGLFGVKPENVPTPEPFNPQNYPMPGVAPEKQNTLDTLARAGTTGVELAAPLTDAAKLASIGGKALLGKLSNITGFNADAKATDFVKNLIGNQSEIKKEFTKNYNDIKSLATKKGYNLQPNSTQKPIEADTFKSELGGLSNDDRTTLFNSLNSKKKALLDKFMDSPSYDNAHKLQTMFGRQGVKFLKNPETAQTGGEILGLRRSLNDDMHNTFVKNGDTDLAQSRQAVTNEYSKNQIRLLLAHKLRSGITDTPDEGLAGNATKISKAYGKVGLDKLLGKPGPNLKTPLSDAAIQDLMKTLNRRSNTKWGLGLSIPAGLIGETIRRHL